MDNNEDNLISDVLNRAYKALYIAKNNAKNKTEVN